MDKVIYKWTDHIVSGHTLKHLCAAMVPVFLTLMLAKRTTETNRYYSCLYPPMVSKIFFSFFCVITAIKAFTVNISDKIPIWHSFLNLEFVFQILASGHNVSQISYKISNSNLLYSFLCKYQQQIKPSSVVRKLK